MVHEGITTLLLIQSYRELTQMIGDEGWLAFILALLLFGVAVVAIKLDRGSVNHGEMRIYSIISDLRKARKCFFCYKFLCP